MGFFSLSATCGVCGEKCGWSRYKVKQSSNELDGIAWCCAKCLKKANKAAGRTLNVWLVTITDIKKIINPESEAAACDVDTEYRKKCNVCGSVFCFRKSDMERNLLLLKEAKTSNALSGLNALGGNAYHMYEQGKRTENALDKIVDYTKCPHCHSADLRDISEEELKAEQAKSNTNSGAAISSADELKKFKELLDSGIITQEEFDAKKKQLLGL